MSKIRSISAGQANLYDIAGMALKFRGKPVLFPAYNLIKLGIITLVYLLCIQGCFFGKIWIDNPGRFFDSVMIAAVVVWSMYFTTIYVCSLERKSYKGIPFPGGIKLFLALFLLNGIMAFVLFWFFIEASRIKYFLKQNDYLMAIISTALVDLIVISCFLEILPLKRKPADEECSSKLKSADIPANFEKLKDQICPHFLFNCFNSLSSLISEDPYRANRFLSELSRVYRYLLHNNFGTLTTLEQEIEFIRSYYHLLETRYSGIHLYINTDPYYHQYQLPPLTLQLLVENAAKHNVIQEDHPLYIDIFIAEPGVLIVQNNKQEKVTKWHSTGIGLKNIRSKYQLLNNKGIEVIDSGVHFSVIVPLLKPKYEIALAI